MSSEKPDPLVLNEDNVAGRDRNLSDVMNEDLDKLSPLGLDFQGQGFSSLHGAQVKTHPQATSGASTTASVDKSCALRHDDGTVSEKRYREQERGSWVNIQLLNKNDSAVANESLNIPEVGDASNLGGSLDRVSLFLEFSCKLSIHCNRTLKSGIP